MSKWDFEEVLMRILLTICMTLVVGLVLGLGALSVDRLVAIRAERKVIACAAQRMDHRRVSFTTDVTCVPKALDTRNDTLTLQQKTDVPADRRHDSGIRGGA